MLFEQLRTCGRPFIIVHFILTTCVLIAGNSTLSLRIAGGTKCDTSLFGCGAGDSEFDLKHEKD